MAALNLKAAPTPTELMIEAIGEALRAALAARKIEALPAMLAEALGDLSIERADADAILTAAGYVAKADKVSSQMIRTARAVLVLGAAGWQAAVDAGTAIKKTDPLMTTPVSAIALKVADAMVDGEALDVAARLALKAANVWTAAEKVRSLLDKAAEMLKDARKLGVGLVVTDEKEAAKIEAAIAVLAAA